MRLKFLAFASLTVIGSSLLLTPLNSSTAHAQNCNYFLERAISGQNVSVDLCSIKRVNSRRVIFTYYLDNKKTQSQANCDVRSWITFPGHVVHQAQSRVAQNMLKIICTAPSFNPGATIGVVFDPPSNVRNRPNGELLCTVREFQAIQIYGGVTGGGDWYRTNVCGTSGVIHKSQVRFR